MYDYTPTSYKETEILEYLRKSRSDDPALSVEEVLAKHETILSDWVSRNIGAAIPEDNIYREVVSGETIDDRPEMLKLLSHIESPKIKAVLVVEVQRLSRGDLEDAGRLMKLLRYTNTKVITPQKTYDLNNEYDRDIFERELKRGNEFLEYQKRILNRGRLLSVSQGNFIGSIPPYGYTKGFIADGKRKHPTLFINPEEAAVVKMIFEMYVNENLGRTTICNRLDEMGIAPPKGKHWSPSAMKDLLENVHYIGKVKWNWRKVVNVVADQEITKTRPKAKQGDYLVYNGKHEAIISDELFYAAREKQGRNHRAKADTKVRNPLAGLLYCQCGRAMSLRTYTKDGIPKSAPRLLCDDQKHCGTGSATYDDVERLVAEALRSHIHNFQVLLKDNSLESQKSHLKLIHSLERKLENLEKKEVKQWETYSEEGMPKNVFDILNHKVLREKEETSAALEKARASIPQTSYYEKKIALFTEALNALENPSIEPAVKNKLLKNCIARITYTRERPCRLKGVSPEGRKGCVYSPAEIQLNIEIYL